MNIFEKTDAKSSEWIQDMMRCLRTDDDDQALHALRAGLHALRDRLTVDEAAQLSAQLPMTIRGLFFENWHPAGKPLRIRQAREFLELVVGNYEPRSDAYADDIIRAVFRVLVKHLKPGEITGIMMSLPEPLLPVLGGRHRAQA